MTSCKAALSLSVLLIATVPLALAQGTYTQIDVPGSDQTGCSGINADGDIVGSYHQIGANYHGFLLKDGTFNTIDYPGAADTFAIGVNNLDQIVGAFQVLSTQPGFMEDFNTGTFTEISFPGSTYNSPNSLNDSGVIVGYYGTSDAQEGFELTGSTYREINFPVGDTTVANGIIATGEIVGYADAPVTNVALNFSFTSGKFQQLNIPVRTANVTGTNPTGHAIVGQYGTASGGIAGFVLQNNRLMRLEFPGSSFTAAVGVNDAGEVVGNFTDASGSGHGFTWTPPADAAKK